VDKSPFCSGAGTSVALDDLVELSGVNAIGGEASALPADPETIPRHSEPSHVWISLFVTFGSNSGEKGRVGRGLGIAFSIASALMLAVSGRSTVYASVDISAGSVAGASVPSTKSTM